MQEGDVVLAAAPQADGEFKPRPAVILREMPPHRDLLVCGVSLQLHQHVRGFDEFIAPGDPDFTASGLTGKSLIRLGFLALVPRRRIPGSIGAISADRHRRLLGRLSEYLVGKFQPGSQPTA